MRYIIDFEKTHTWLNPLLLLEVGWPKSIGNELWDPLDRVYNSSAELIYRELVNLVCIPLSYWLPRYFYEKKYKSCTMARGLNDSVAKGTDGWHHPQDSLVRSRGGICQWGVRQFFGHKIVEVEIPWRLKRSKSCLIYCWRREKARVFCVFCWKIW